MALQRSKFFKLQWTAWTSIKSDSVLVFLLLGFFSPVKLQMQCITGKTICCSFSEAADSKNLTSEVEWTIDISNPEAIYHLLLLEMLTISSLPQNLKPNLLGLSLIHKWGNYFNIKFKTLNICSWNSSTFIKKPPSTMQLHDWLYIVTVRQTSSAPVRAA